MFYFTIQIMSMSNLIQRVASIILIIFVPLLYLNVFQFFLCKNSLLSKNIQNIPVYIFPFYESHIPHIKWYSDVNFLGVYFYTTDSAAAEWRLKI